MPVCKKCHKFKKKKVFARHKKTCIPKKEDIEFGAISRVEAATKESTYWADRKNKMKEV